MADGIVSVSREELAVRRQQLRVQRRMRILRRCWRFVAISGITGGVIWVGTSPMFWMLERPEQVRIEGNRLIQTQTVRSHLPLDFPQSVLSVEPQAIADHLKTSMPFVEVRVSRQLFPPGLTVQLEEPYPVALTLPDPATPINPTAAANSTVGLLDKTGRWIPLEQFVAVEQSVELPSLKVIGDPAVYRPYWPQMYQTISRSPITITEVDWRDSNNLIIKTDLGVVHLGPYSAQQFPTQISTLDTLRNAVKEAAGKPIQYIDLSSPENPKIQTSSAKTP